MSQFGDDYQASSTQRSPVGYLLQGRHFFVAHLAACVIDSPQI